MGTRSVSVTVFGSKRARVTLAVIIALALLALPIALVLPGYIKVEREMFSMGYRYGKMHGSIRLEPVGSAQDFDPVFGGKDDISDTTEGAITTMAMTFAENNGVPNPNTVRLLKIIVASPSLIQNFYVGIVKRGYAQGYRDAKQRNSTSQSL